MSTVVCALPAESPNRITHGELTRVIGGLLLVLLIILVLSWLVKRLQGVNLGSAKGFQSIASIHLGPKERLVLMKVSSRYLLMGVSTGTITLIHDFGEQLPAGFDGENKPAFSELLKSAIGKTAK
ncbi:flagellar biosynthetic protein FliO [Legionella shakespearei]|nr:flagellar biosynthetic protein FliO [Legionella shakespearei]